MKKQKKTYTATINATAAKLWDVLWADETYRKWTSVFSEGSHAVTDWQKGSKVLFLGENGDGMIAKIADNIPNKYMSIHHIGMIKNGVEDYDSEEVKKWGEAFENYTLKETNSKTELTVEIDVNDEWQDYFDQTWPKAFAKLKELAEG